MKKDEFDTLCNALHSIGRVRYNNENSSVAASLRHAEHVIFNVIDDALHNVEPEERKSWYETAIIGCSYGVLLDLDKEILSEWVESLKDLGA